jgi:hypothetical protein
MENSSPPMKRPSALKRLAIISLFGGAGFALVAALICGGVLWYTSRPKPPKPWNTSVIIARVQPEFDLSDDGKMLILHYTLENTGSSDYRIDSVTDLQLLARRKNGVLSQPLPDADKILRLPIFIPTKQKSSARISLPYSGIVTRNTAEPDAALHERLRNYLEQKYGFLSGFVIFDGTNRYQIDLPKWSEGTPR